jgi:hypothetical protein
MTDIANRLDSVPRAAPATLRCRLWEASPRRRPDGCAAPAEVGMHWHRCPRCGFCWEHASTSANIGNVQAHTCPSCRRGMAWFHYGGPLNRLLPVHR